MPTPPLLWMLWVPWIVAAAVMARALVLWVMVEPWLAISAGSGMVGPGRRGAAGSPLTAAQLFPVIEFTQRTSRAAEGGTHDIYPFSVEPYRLARGGLAQYPGEQFEGNNYWGALIHVPGVRPKAGCRHFTWGD